MSGTHTSPNHSANPGELSVAEVTKVAGLARLLLSPQELESSRRDLAAVLGYMDRLRGLAVDSSAADANVTQSARSNRLAADIAEPSMSLMDQVMTLPADGGAFVVDGLQSTELGPQSSLGFFKVPKVLGEAGGA